MLWGGLVAGRGNAVRVALWEGDCGAGRSALSSAAPPVAGPGSGRMAETKWSIRGEYMESCNCDYLCPCVYTNPQGPVTYDHCTAVLVFRIDDGDFGGGRLDGLKIAFLPRCRKGMADGKFVFA